MTTLYLDRDHVDISARTGHLRLRTGSGRSTTVPLSQLERLVVRGRVALDSNVIGSFADKGIAVTFLGGRSHRRLAMLLGRGGQDSQRRLLQYRASSNENWCCQASRRLLVAKLAATCHELDAILQQRPDRRRVLVQARRSISRRIDTLEIGAGNRDTMLVGHAANSVTLSRRTSVVGKARERRTGHRQFKRAERSPQRLCGGPSGATVPARLGVAFLGKGTTIPCKTRLDSHRHSGSEGYRISRMAH